MKTARGWLVYCEETGDALLLRQLGVGGKSLGRSLMYVPASPDSEDNAPFARCRLFALDDAAGYFLLSTSGVVCLTAPVKGEEPPGVEALRDHPFLQPNHPFRCLYRAAQGLLTLLGKGAFPHNVTSMVHLLAERLGVGVDLFYQAPEAGVIVFSSDLAQEQLEQLRARPDVLDTLSACIKTCCYLNDLPQEHAGAWYALAAYNLDKTVGLHTGCDGQNSFMLLRFTELTPLFSACRALHGFARFLAYVLSSRHKQQGAQNRIWREESTGLPNWLMFKSVFPLEQERSFRLNYPLALVLARVSAPARAEARQIAWAIQRALRRLDGVFAFSPNHFLLFLTNVQERYLAAPIQRMEAEIQAKYPEATLHMGVLFVYPYGREIDLQAVMLQLNHMLEHAVGSGKQVLCASNAGLEEPA